MPNFATECDQVARLIGTGFINAAVPSLLIVMLAFAALRPKRISSATRVWAWFLVLASLVFLPVGMLLLRPSLISRPEPIPTVSSQIPVTAGGLWPTKPSPVLPLSVRKTLSPAHWESALAAAALLLVVVRLFRLVFGLSKALKLKRQATRELSYNLDSRTNQLLHPDCRTRPILVAVSCDLTMPVVVGYRQPAILLPAYLLETLDSPDIEQVLLHELAHVDRYDDWSLLLQRTVESLFAFHPLVQFVGRQINLHREIACDDRVLSSLQPKAYASCLARIAELSSSQPAMGLSPSFVEQKGQLSRRLESMLDRTREHMPALSARYLLSFAGGVASLALISLKTPAMVAYPASQAFVQAAATAADPNPGNAASAQTDSKADLIDSLTITSGDAKSFFYQNYGDSNQHRFNFPKNAIIYRRDGVQWVIRDPKVISEVQTILRPQEDLGRQQAALAAEQAKLGKAQADLGAEQAAFGNRKLEPAEVQALQRELRGLEDKVRSIATDGTEKTASEAQGQLATLQAQIGEMLSSMGQEQAKIAGEQAKLGAAQAQLGAQQAHLGAQQSKLGSAQAQAGKLIQGKLHELIRRAEAQHLSQPLL